MKQGASAPPFLYHTTETRMLTIGISCIATLAAVSAWNNAVDYFRK